MIRRLLALPLIAIVVIAAMSWTCLANPWGCVAWLMDPLQPVDALLGTTFGWMFPT